MHIVESSGRVHLLERDREVAALRAALGLAASGRGSMVVVDGPSGIGITALLDSVARAFANAADVVVVRPSEFDAELPFGSAVHIAEQLAVINRRHVRPDVKGAAAGLVDALLSAGRSPSDLLTVFQQTLDVVRRTAEERTLVLIIDDACWLDQWSARLVTYLAGRLLDIDALLVVNARCEVGTTEPTVLAALRAHAATTLSLAPLTASAIATMIAAEGLGTVDGTELRTVTGGLPAVVADLMHLVRQGPPGATAEELTERALEASGRSVPARLERLDRVARAALQLASLLGTFDAPMLSRVLDLSPYDVETAAMAAVSLGFLMPECRTSFVHAEIRRAIEATIPRSVATEWHAAAAQELLVRGARPQLVARHLLELAPAGRDDWADTLFRAGRASFRSGHLQDSVRLLRRALVEPPAPARAHKVREELIAALVQCDDASWRSELSAAIASSPEYAHRLQAAAGWSLHLRGHTAQGAPLLRRAWEGVDDPRSDVAIELLTKLAIVNRARVDDDLSLVCALEAVEDDDRCADRPASRALLAQLAYQRSLGGADASRVSGLVARAFDPRRVDGVELAANPALIAGLLATLFVDATEEFDDVVARVRPHAERAGTLTLVGAIANVVAAQLLVKGAISRARAEATRAAELLSLADAVTLPGALGNLALARLESGDVGGAAAALDLRDTSRLSGTSPYTAWLYARGRVRHAQGDHAGALDDYLEVGRRQDATAITNPVILPWWQGAAFLHVAAGRLEAAGELVASFGEAATQVGTSRARALVSRVEARIVAIGDRAAAAAILDTAAEELRSGAHGADLVRVLLDRCALARVAGDRRLAGRLAREAYDRATPNGAEQDASRARAELVAAGRRPRARTGGELTPAEERVARLAASGLTNREIAAELYVSGKAVEFHLSNIFRKLGVTRRAELRRRHSPGVDP